MHTCAPRSVRVDGGWASHCVSRAFLVPQREDSLGPEGSDLLTGSPIWHPPGFHVATSGVPLTLLVHPPCGSPRPTDLCRDGFPRETASADPCFAAVCVYARGGEAGSLQRGKRDQQRSWLSSRHHRAWHVVGANAVRKASKMEGAGRGLDLHSSPSLPHFNC